MSDEPRFYAKTMPYSGTWPGTVLIYDRARGPDADWVARAATPQVAEQLVERLNGCRGAELVDALETIAAGPNPDKPHVTSWSARIARDALAAFRASGETGPDRPEDDEEGNRYVDSY